MHKFTPTAPTTILATLARINAALAADPNCLTLTKSGGVNPDKAYIELVRDLVNLNPASN